MSAVVNLSFWVTFHHFLSSFKLLSAKTWSLEEPKICCLGKDQIWSITVKNTLAVTRPYFIMSLDSQKGVKVFSKYFQK